MTTVTRLYDLDRPPHISTALWGTFTRQEQAELTDAYIAQLPAAPSNGTGRVRLVRLVDVVPERVEWLWPTRIPFGKITVLDGDPGLAKSTMSLDLAARVSTGSSMPDGGPTRPPADAMPHRRPRMASPTPSGPDSTLPARTWLASTP